MRFIYFLLVVCVALYGPLWSFVIAALAYGLFYTPYELLVLAVFIDAEFGDTTRSAWYAYTLTVSIILILTTYIKPYLRFYKE